LVRKRADDLDHRVDVRLGDITDPNLDWAGLVDGVDTAFHLAWTTVPYSANADPAANIEQNLPAGLRLGAALSRRPGARMVFFSSGGTVYGPASIPVTEDYPQAPTSFYGEGKLQMERLLSLLNAQSGLERVALRISNPYGPGQRSSGHFGAVATFAARALACEPITIWGDGSIVRDYLFVEDLMDAVVKAARVAKPSATYNLGSGEGRALNEIVEELHRLLARRVEVRYEPPRAYDVPVNVLDITRATVELNWTPRTSFEDGLSVTVASMSGGRG
jgi:UDP-glucose 4-epimerase